MTFPDSIAAQKPKLFKQNKELELTEYSRQCECWKAWIEIYRKGERVYAVAQECLEEYDLRVCIRNTCFQNNEQSDYALIPINFKGEVSFEEQLIDIISDLTENGTSNCTATINATAILDGMGTPQIPVFHIDVQSWSFGSFDWIPNNCQLDVPFNYLSSDSENNQIYQRVFLENNITAAGREICYYDGHEKVKLCGSEGSKVISSANYQIQYTSETSSTGKSTLKGTVGGTGKVGNLPLSLGIEFDTEVSFEHSIANSISETFNTRIEQTCTGIENKCIWPGYRERYTQLRIETWQVSCVGPDLLVDSKNEWLLTNLDHFCCSSEHCSDCLPIRNYTPKIEKEITPGSEFNLIQSACLGSITMSFDYPEDYLVYWAGPNGFESNEEELYGLELGAYHYTINNCCGEILSGVVELCDNPQSGSWYYDDDNGEYCRIVECNDLPAFKVVECSYEECVTADFIETEVDGDNCIERHYYQGEYLGTQITGQTEVKVEYDGNICYERIYCGVDIISERQEAPIFGTWVYDIIDETCQRSITCFNIELNQYDQEEPEYNYDYDEFHGLCNKTAKCGAFIETTLAPIYPIHTGPWQWSELNGCERDVRCSINSETEIDKGVESFSNWRYDNFSNMCQADVYCDHDPIFGKEHRELPRNYGRWNWTSSRPWEKSCRRTVFCGELNTVVYQRTEPTLQFKDEDCDDALCSICSAYYIICNGYNTYDVICAPGINVNADNYLIRPEKSLMNAPGQKSFSISPNPFNHYINIIGLDSNNEYEYSIATISGEILVSGKELTGFRISTSSLSDGIYILNIKNNKVNIYRKIIK